METWDMHEQDWGLSPSGQSTDAPTAAAESRDTDEGRRGRDDSNNEFGPSHLWDQLIGAIEEDDFEVVASSIGDGALGCWEASGSEEERDYPLLLAVSEGCSSETVEALLQAGLNPNGVDREGDCAMHLAAASGSPNVLAALLRAGGNPLIAVEEFPSPLEIAASAWVDEEVWDTCSGIALRCALMTSMSGVRRVRALAILKEADECLHDEVIQMLSYIDLRKSPAE